ncbi:mitochondrial ornithine transporter 1 [Caerostris extrusa]|uniref:Mitochondrial ornithine transporter 1 n=1 Tax=Caerostris extrusa TaxID=172846 RepID=A0AAV4Y3W7_CAEEX|nr:mitochondrial ornithine transporter 1 [Caerostris extrusa]
MKDFVGLSLCDSEIGGAACVFVGQPLDTIKVKMQTFPNLYKNSFICFKETLVKEGFRGLYAGTVPALAANIAENSVLFCAYGVCQNAVKFLIKKDDVLDLNPLENATAGFFAAFFSSFSLCPTELIKCRLQAMRETSCNDVHNRTNIGPWSLTKEIFRTEGKSKDEIGLFRTIIAGGIGGVSFWVAIFPADVIKSRLQISKTNDSTIEVTKQLIRKDGFRALYKGLGPTVLRTFPASGALFVAQDQIGLVDSALGFWIRVDGFKTLLVMHRQKSVAGIRGMD